MVEENLVKLHFYKMNLSKKQCDELINYSVVDYEDRFTNMHQYSDKLFEPNNDVKKSIKEYCYKKLNLVISNVKVGVLKYEKGGFFKRHIDRNSKYDFNKDFLYNINVRLNDDYDGGEFYLNDKPFYKPVGEIYHYKSSEYHEVKQVTKGVRYTALFYIRERDVLENLNNKNLL